jgi:hypothetical protein
MTEDTDPSEPSDQSIVEEARRRRLEDAKKSYEQVINRLWAGNAAGIFAVLGALETEKTRGLPIFVALCAFLLGLLSLAVGAFCSLLSHAKAIRELENVDSLLDVMVHYVRRPSDEAGLTINNLQTVMGILSAILFFIGVGLGLFYVAATWRSNASI